MSSVFQLRTVERKLPAKDIMLIKQLTNQSIDDVKRKIADGSAVLECGLNDNKQLALIIELYDQLTEDGIRAETLYNDRVECIDVLKNVLNSHRQTALEVGFTEEEINY